MLKKEFEIPFWLALLMAGLLLGLGGALVYFSNNSSEYNLFLSSEGGSRVSFEYGALPSLSNVNFFADVKNRFIRENARFVEADLEAMRLRVYEGPTILKEVPILTKGKKGSWWETPAGLYRIETKERNHFSSIGRVNMPWSMQFQGNFFIHGWPTYSDGSVVSSQYSGGCIRLSTEDAAEIFDLVETATPVLVFEDHQGVDGFVHKLREPDISAKQYLAADIKNNFVFLEKGSRDVLPFGSVSRLLSALVASEYINLDQGIMMTEALRATTTTPRLNIGARYSAFELLYPMLRESSNEASRALAEFIGRKQFVSLMNKSVGSIGMVNTKVSDLYGDTEGTVSTGEDLFALAKYLYGNRSFVLQVSSGRSLQTAYGNLAFRDLDSQLALSGDPRFVGGIADFNHGAPGAALAVFEIMIRGEKRPVAVVLFSSQNPTADLEAVVNYVENFYR